MPAGGLPASRGTPNLRTPTGGRSSGVEHGVYTAGVGGSKPSARTMSPPAAPLGPSPAAPSAGAAGPSGAGAGIYLRASLRPLPGLNLARFEAGILIGAPVRGLRPSLALRSVTE
jgi:hypothetical protein